MKERFVDASVNNILVNKVLTTMRERGQTPIEASAAMEVGYSYFMALLRGERRMADASKQTLSKIARYLKISTVQAFFWAGAILPEDFLVEEDVEALLNKAYQAMLRDSRVAHLAPPVSEWNGLTTNAKILIASLYGMATGTEPLPSAQIPDESTGEPTTGEPTTKAGSTASSGSSRPLSAALPT